MAFIMLESHASAPDVLITDAGVVVPGAGQSVYFEEFAHVADLQRSPILRQLVADDAYGASQHSLTLYTQGGVAVPPGFAETYLSRVLRDKPGRVARSGNFMYFARTRTPGALDANPVWQIYRFDLVTSTKLFADGDANFDNIWNTGADPPTYETLTYS